MYLSHAHTLTKEYSSKRLLTFFDVTLKLFLSFYYIYIYIYRCNQLEKWPSDRNNTETSKKLVREQILKARAVSRKTLLNNNPQVEDRLVLNLTYHPLL